MRFLSLIITILIIGVLAYKQLGKESSEDSTSVNSTSLDVPKVPTKPNEVQAFEKQINDFVNATAKETARRVEEAEGKK